MNQNIPTAYQVAQANIARQASAEAAAIAQSVIPGISYLGRVNGVLDHCQDKAGYVEFRRQWRELYRWLSQTIRLQKECHAVHRSLLDLSRNATIRPSDPVLQSRITLRRARMEELKTTTTIPPLWWRENMVQKGYIRPSAPSAVASWLVALRVESKRQAQIGWEKARDQKPSA